MSKISVFSKKSNKAVAVNAKKVSSGSVSVMGWSNGGWSKSGGWVQL